MPALLYLVLCGQYQQKNFIIIEPQIYLFLIILGWKQLT